jgi:LPS sulfotransferase NodH
MTGSLLQRTKRVFGGHALEASAAIRALFARPAGQAERLFMVFGRGRSGSTLLVNMLDAHPEVTCLGEILRYRTFFPVPYITNALSALPTPCRGFKLLSYQLRSNEVRVIHMRRDNLFSHAVSNIYATRRGAYHSTDRQARAHRRIHIDPGEIRSWMDGSRALLMFEREFLADMAPLEVVYERDLEDAARQAGTYAAAIDYLGLAAHPPVVTLEKVTPRDYPALISNYAEIRRALQGTEYAAYLPE